jgi:branched-chain amino acid aminotransferase
MAAFLNDDFLENDQALLHVSDLSMQRGYGVFDFFRTVNGTPLYMQQHLDRFFASAENMHLPVNKTREELCAIVYTLIKQSALAEAGIRLMLTGGYSADGYVPATPNLLITCNPVKTATAHHFEKGVSAITYPYQRELPHIKSIHYLMAVWLQPLLKEKKADEVLYYQNNVISEFPRSNVFVVTKNDTLLTPARNILSGITRKNVLSLATAFMKVEERDITLEEVANAAELFFTSTTRRIMPVVNINNRLMSNGRPGKFTIQLYQQLVALEKKEAGQ